VINGLVADATGGTLVVNVGTRGGVRVGDKLAVTRVGRVIKDPATGNVLRTVEETNGASCDHECRRTEREGRFTGTGKPQVGDSVKTASPN
jgi:hypothetical protein